METNLLAAAILVFVLSQITILFTSVYLHRSLAHRSVKLHPAVALAMRIWIWALTYQVARTWVAVHRKHHQFADRNGDPHSPHVFGVWKVLLFNTFYYDKESRCEETVAKYAKDIPKRRGDYFLDQSLFGVLAGVILFGFGFSLWMGFWPGFIVGVGALVAHIFIYQSMGAVVNSICHWFGYKNFHDNKATNVGWVGLWTAGEGWHNNHHHDPMSPKLGYRPWEMDFAWWFIKLLSWMKLADPLMTTAEKELQINPR